jgi:hypothetical protein
VADSGRERQRAEDDREWKWRLTVGKAPSLVWRNRANEDVCVAIPCACWFLPHPVTDGWPPASESDYANGDATWRRTDAANAGGQETTANGKRERVRCLQ